MPKAKTAAKPEKSKEDALLGKIGEMLSPIAEEMKSMGKRISDLEKEKPASEKDREVIRASDTEKVYNPNDIPVTDHYRNMISDMLGEEFGLSMSMADGGFAVTVSVPQEYSNLSPAHFKERGGDLRTKVIDNAKGEIGVREWFELIRHNLRDKLKK